MAVINGGPGDDPNLFGGVDDDIVNGNGGNDVIDGGSGGIDTLNGGTGDDTIYARTDDLAYGGDGNDLISIDGSFPAVLDGGTNYDILRFGSGYDISGVTLTGFEQLNAYGNGALTTTQLASFALVSGYASNYTNAQLILTQGGTANVTLAATLTEYFSITGSAEAEKLTFTAGYNGIINAFMGAGDDNVTTSNGNDSLRGEDGNDTLSGMAGNDVLDGGSGANKLFGGTGNDTLVMHSGDTIDGGTGDDLFQIVDNFPASINGGGGLDVIRFEGGYDISGCVLTGIDQVLLTGTNYMTASQIGSFALITGYNVGTTGAAITLTEGGTANVTLSATLSVYFQLNGSAQADIITVTPGYIGTVYAYMGAGDDNVTACNGNDSMRGEDGNDTLTGSIGNDSIDGGAGMDSLDGGTGDDTLIVRAFDSAYGGNNNDLFSITEGLPAVLNGGTGQDTIRFEGGYDISSAILTGIETAFLYSNVQMTAAQLAGFTQVSGYSSAYTSASVYLTQGGTAAVNVAPTLALSFTLVGSSQADLITFNAAYIGQVLVSAGSGNDSITAANGADNLRGENGNDTLIGLGGNDSLDGGFGADLLNGGTGNDTLIGRAHDTMIGGANDDLISITENLPALIDGGTGTDILRLEGGYDISGATITGIEQLYANGVVTLTAAQLDAFTTVAGYNSSYTSAYVHLSVGGVATVSLSTTLGVSFQLTGSSQDDDITFNASYLGQLQLYGGYGNDSFTGAAGNDSMRGDQGNDALVSLGGNDTLDGGAGADTLNGGTGIDVLTGGAGRDVFVFGTVSSSVPATPDRINDFEAAGNNKGDLIDVSLIDADGALGLNNTFVFGSAGLGGLSVIDAGTDTLVRLNTDNDAAFEVVILIADGGVLASSYTAADFIL